MLILHDAIIQYLGDLKMRKDYNSNKYDATVKSTFIVVDSSDTRHSCSLKDLHFNKITFHFCTIKTRPPPSEEFYKFKLYKFNAGPPSFKPKDPANVVHEYVYGVYDHISLKITTNEIIPDSEIDNFSIGDMMEICGFITLEHREEFEFLIKS